MKIYYDGCVTAVDGSSDDVIRGVERILEEEAYRRKSSVWGVLKDLTVAVVNREKYKEFED